MARRKKRKQGVLSMLDKFLFTKSTRKSRRKRRHGYVRYPGTY